jgi:hypothetical protein
VGSLAFELTGMSTQKAFFQSLSCFTGTGFTTSESELITRHRERRKIACVLMILGNVGAISLIATMANHIQDIFKNPSGYIGIPFTDIGTHIQPNLLELIKILLAAIALYLIYHFFINSSISQKLFKLVKNKMKKMKIIHPSVCEDLVEGISDYDIIKLKVSPESKFCDKSLAESELRSQHKIQILAVERDSEITTHPENTFTIKAGDLLICYGDRKEIIDSFHI